MSKDKKKQRYADMFPVCMSIASSVVVGQFDNSVNSYPLPSLNNAPWEVTRYVKDYATVYSTCLIIF